MNFKIYLTMVTYTALNENWEKFLERDKGLKYPCGSWKDFGGNWYNYLSFIEPDSKIEISFEKEVATEESNVDFEIGVNGPSTK